MRSFSPEKKRKLQGILIVLSHKETKSKKWRERKESENAGQRERERERAREKRRNCKVRGVFVCG